jgi:hypothetical protein
MRSDSVHMQNVQRAGILLAGALRGCFPFRFSKFDCTVYSPLSDCAQSPDFIVTSLIPSEVGSASLTVPYRIKLSHRTFSPLPTMAVTQWNLRLYGWVVT